MFPGIGTVVNVATVLLGTGLGVLLGHRLPSAPATSSPTALGLVTLLIAGLSALAVTDPALVDAVGDSAPMLIVLGLGAGRRHRRLAARLEERVEASAAGCSAG